MLRVLDGCQAPMCRVNKGEEMGEKEIITWRGNDEPVRLHIPPRPSKTERCRFVLGRLVGGRDGEFACGQCSGFSDFPK